ncbi:hypothetical protein EMQ_1585 [Acetobacter aceti NBRC 14818]|uniref:Transposase n=1 Tax=Acetobacter aceti NBRC 14818 TaxID=887700 RepID=A0AB33IJE6_ACEAC|nr:hypothetical protein EMQ_1585 [Acetobacter aceti NBRC 14818]GAN58422.1 hypothetical protein Abac_049_017 [Acetobacter aceti NBRC 14818]
MGEAVRSSRKHNKAVEQVVAIWPFARDMQVEIDLRMGCFCETHGFIRLLWDRPVRV